MVKRNKERLSQSVEMKKLKEEKKKENRDGVVVELLIKGKWKRAVRRKKKEKYQQTNKQTNKNRRKFLKKE